MPYQLNAEFQHAMADLFEAMANTPPIPVGEVQSRREALNTVMTPRLAMFPDTPDVEETIYHTGAHDGHQIPIYHFKKRDSTINANRPAIYYLHGGGYFCMDVPFYRKIISNFVSQSGVDIFAVDYRISPEVHFPTPLDDAWAGLRYLSQNAATYHIDNTRIAVMGDSAGGGLAAGLVLKARDEQLSPPVVKQILIYPMLDNQTTKPIASKVPFFTWSYEDNTTGWQAYLGDDFTKGEEVSCYASASRAKTLAGLPPTYLDVGELDILRDENLNYIRRLTLEDVSVEFHLYAGLPHAFELFARGIEASAVAARNRVKAMTSF